MKPEAVSLEFIMNREQMKRIASENSVSTRFHICPFMYVHTYLLETELIEA